MVDTTVDSDIATVVEVVVDATSLTAVVVSCLTAGLCFMAATSSPATVVTVCLAIVTLLVVVVSGFRVTTHRRVVATVPNLPATDVADLAAVAADD
jgi:hypothetical protein